MNLNIYDKVEVEHQNWLDPRYHKFYSKVIPKYSFFSILKRYNGKDNDWYLLLSNTLIEGYVFDSVIHNRNYSKYNFYRYWKAMGLNSIDSVTEVNVRLEDSDDNSAIYYLDI